MCFNFFKKKNKQNASPLWQPEPAMPELNEDRNDSATQTDSQPQAASADFKFKLTIMNCRGVQDDQREILEPTIEDFSAAIDNNKLFDENFFVLESATPIKNCSILQCAGYNSDADSFDAEIVREEADGKGGKVLKAYHCDLSAIDLIKTMREFVGGQIPDLDGGSDWYFMMEL